LRKEAEALEETVRGTRDAATRNREKDSKNKSEETKMKATYTSLQDSKWEVSYRFASDAIKRDGSDDDQVKPVFYSGKVKISLSEDGYTNMINSDADSTKDSSSSSGPTFEKFWGWDEEISTEDELQYVLFSADVLLPESDPNHVEKAVRFYFQAQENIDNKSNEITLSGGTVTIKKDVESPGGFWSVFNSSGILAQFRYCGEFIMKPC